MYERRPVHYCLTQCCDVEVSSCTGRPAFYFANNEYEANKLSNNTAGIIAENKVTPLLYFFIKAWKNEQIHRWLTANHSTILRENRVLTLMNFLYEKGSVFEYDCKRSTIAHLLLETGDLCTISSYKTVMNNFSMDISPMVASQAESIFTDTFIP